MEEECDRALRSRPNPRLQTVCDALDVFLDFTGRWDELLALHEQADAVLACADRAAAHWAEAFPPGPARPPAPASVPSPSACAASGTI